MIYRLQKKFIRICAISFFIVFAAIFSTVYLFTYYQATTSSDHLADIIEENGENFPPFDPRNVPQRQSPLFPNEIGPESPFTTRFFIIRFDDNGEIKSSNTASIASVSGSEAEEYGYAALQNGNERGWIDEYRYKTISTNDGVSIIFINNIAYKNTARLIMISALVILMGGGLIFFTVVVIFSKRAVQPVAESYEKQKRFITNANHELKTPLTLMMTNLDIIETELGQSEWLDDVRMEGREMEELINRLVYLARMDEAPESLDFTGIKLSDMLQEMTSLFQPLSVQKGLVLLADIASDVSIPGNEDAIRQLLSILMENAFKYCDTNGTISVTLRGGSSPTLLIDNHYSGAGELDISSLFDRFYRADKARTSGSGFGIGLSVAKAIAENHGAEIWAESKGNSMIRFGVRFSVRMQQRKRKSR